MNNWFVVIHLGIHNRHFGPYSEKKAKRLKTELTLPAWKVKNPNWGGASIQQVEKPKTSSDILKSIMEEQ
jgi:hypothetical protein